MDVSPWDYMAPAGMFPSMTPLPLPPPPGPRLAPSLPGAGLSNADLATLMSLDPSKLTNPAPLPLAPPPDGQMRMGDDQAMAMLNTSQAGPLQGASDASTPPMPPPLPPGPPNAKGHSIGVAGGMPRGPDWSAFDALSKALGQQGQSAVDRQNQGLLDAEAQIRMALEHSQPQLDLSPLAALTDSWSGSHLASGYARPDYAKDNANIQGLTQNLQKGRNDLSDRESMLLKDRLGIEEKKLGAQQHSADMAQQMLMHQQTLADSAANRGSLKDRELLTHYQDKLNADPDYKDGSAKLVEIQQARTAIEKAHAGNVGALGPVKMLMGRVFSPSRLTETEINNSGGSQALADKIGQAIDTGAGRGLSDANYRYMNDLLDGVEANARGTLTGATARHATNYSQASGVPLEDAARRIGTTLPAASAAAPAATTPAAPKVGEVQDGHRFKGGNPADPNSWEKT